MFRGNKSNHFQVLVVSISLAACIPNLSIAADAAPSDIKTTTAVETTASPAPAQSSPTPTSPVTPTVSPSTTPGISNATTPTTTTTSVTTTTSSTPATTTTPEKLNTNATTPNTNQTTSNEIQVSAAEKQIAIMDFLKKAAEYIKDNGKENALAEFNKPNSIFSKDSLYVFAVKYDGTILATQSFEQKLLGTNQLSSEDPDGVTFIQSLIEKAKSGGGWVLYKTENPISKIVECKNAYVIPGNISGTSDYLIGTGYYYPIAASGKCEPEK